MYGGTLTLRVKNWEKFQHYKDRRPPWIKLYHELLDNLDYHLLSPKAGKALPLIWLLGSESDGILPDAKEMAFRIRYDLDITEIVLKELTDAEFLEEISAEQVATHKPEGSYWGSRYIPEKLRQKIFKRDKTCRWCDSKDNLEIDHIVPVSRGGEPTEENLQVLCRSCNRKKRAQTPSEQVATQTKKTAEQVAISETETETESETDQSKSPRTRGSQIKDDWNPTDDHKKLAQQLGVDLQHEADAFRDHALATGRTLKDWDAGFRNWLRQAKKFGGKSMTKTKHQQNMDFLRREMEAHHENE